MCVEKDYLGAALCFRFVCGRSRYVQGLPKRAHRWHRLTACGVHFALTAVHDTHALLLTAGIVAFMMSPKDPGEETERPVDVERSPGGPGNRTIRSDRFVISPKYITGIYIRKEIDSTTNQSIHHWNYLLSRLKK
jgi:hypothetical protein